MSGGNVPGLPPISYQKILLSVDLNSEMLGVLLIGAYTIIYLGALYIYMTRKSSHSQLVISVITLLYLVYVAQLSVGWFIVSKALITHGDTRATAFIAAFSNKNWDILFNDVCNFVISVLSDGLLIWRCYNVWDQSIRAILVSLVLYLAEIALYLAIIIIACAHNLRPSISVDNTLNHLFSAAVFLTLAATLATTIVIAYRIYSVQRHHASGPQKQSFYNILDILVQSAAIYSFIALLYAIVGALPLNGPNQTTILQLQNYIGTIFSFTECVAPTILVARIALTSSTPVDPRSTVHISNLEFGGQSMSANGTQHMVESIRTSGRDTGLSDAEK